MKRYTQADFDALTRDVAGYMHLPTGDWRGVDFRGADKLIFGNDCVLGDDCVLGNYCKLGVDCMTGDGCGLGVGCKLGSGCELGNRCRIGNGCAMEGGLVQNAAYFFASNIGSRNCTAYAYCNTATGDIYVRAGCWFGSVDDFVTRVRNVHGGTQHETDYLAFADFARARFARYGQKGGGRTCRG